MKTPTLACAAMLAFSSLAIAQTQGDSNQSPGATQNGTSTSPPSTSTAESTVQGSTLNSSDSTGGSTTGEPATGNPPGTGPYSNGNASRTTSGMDKVASSDAMFMKKLAEGDMAEADAGKLAAQKSDNQAVKEFGQEMNRDHSKNSADLKSLAASRGVLLPSSVDKDHAEAKAKLQNLSGSSFDRQYAKNQVRDHEKTVQLLQSEITSGQDQAVKDFATQTLQVVNDHLDKARQLQSTVSNSVASK